MALGVASRNKIQRLREQGCRITKQRLMLDSGRRMCFLQRNLLQSIQTESGNWHGYSVLYGELIGRNWCYACGTDCGKENACTIELDDATVQNLSLKNWNAVILAGLKSCGYIDHQRIKSVAPFDVRLFGDIPLLCRLTFWLSARKTI